MVKFLNTGSITVHKVVVFDRECFFNMIIATLSLTPQSMLGTVEHPPQNCQIAAYFTGDCAFVMDEWMAIFNTPPPPGGGGGGGTHMILVIWVCNYVPQ